MIFFTILVFVKSQPIPQKKFNYVPQIKSDGQQKSTKLLISWQELKNEFRSLFVHRKLLGR